MLLLAFCMEVTWHCTVPAVQSLQQQTAMAVIKDSTHCANLSHGVAPGQRQPAPTAAVARVSQTEPAVRIYRPRLRNGYCESMKESFWKHVAD